MEKLVMMLLVTFYLNRLLLVKVIIRFIQARRRIYNIGYRLRTLANENLAWERTAQTNIAVDLKLFNNFSLTVDAYQKKPQEF
jgi:Na+/serine symporter